MQENIPHQTSVAPQAPSLRTLTTVAGYDSQLFATPLERD
jgi:hypothetical protein